MTLDLRSDTLTQPTAAMRQAMATAVVGDDVFGEDPTLTALQERCAAMSGKEAALFMRPGMCRFPQRRRLSRAPQCRATTARIEA